MSFEYISTTSVGGDTQGQALADLFASDGWTVTHFLTAAAAKASGVPAAIADFGDHQSLIGSWLIEKAGCKSLFWKAGSYTQGYLHVLEGGEWLAVGHMSHNLVSYCTDHTYNSDTGEYLITARNTDVWNPTGWITWTCKLSTTPVLITPATVELDAGTYEYAASLDGYRTQTGTIVVVEGETNELALTMVALAGTVQVTSTPSGATVDFEPHPDE